jgi:hypothetical protein
MLHLASLGGVLVTLGGVLSHLSHIVITSLIDTPIIG